MLKILIVDDEPLAGGMLRLLIEKHIGGDKEITVCTVATEAIKLIPLFKPTLLMLDIEMPHMSGFDLLNKLGHWDFDVVFTTAYDKYAIKAIRFSALDYLLKPIDPEELQQAVSRHLAKSAGHGGQQQLLVGNLISNLQQRDMASYKLALSTLEGYFFYNPKDILRCEGDDNYTHFYFVQGRPLVVSRTLKEFEEILADHSFMRVHKSHLVNKRYIVRMDKDDILWLADGTRVAVSRRRKKEVVDMLAARKG